MKGECNVCDVRLKSTQPISLKLDVIIGPTNRKLQMITEHFSISLTIAKRDFGRFISIYHAVTGRFLRYLAK